MPLVRCPGCQRHVMAADTACPFCSFVVPRGSSFAALVAVAAGLTVLSGCPDPLPPPPTPVARYGAPPIQDRVRPEPAPIDSTTNQTPAPVYGGPPVERK